MKERRIETPNLPEFEKFLLKLQPLREGDVVLIRVQDWNGKHRKVEARVVKDEGSFYVFECLNKRDSWSFLPFAVKKKNIERRLYKVWRKEELEGDERSVNS